MSSSNEIDIIYAPETVTYGVVESGQDFETVRKTSDGLSGTPETSVSAEARKDRQSAGQILVGLEVGGPIGYELSASKCFDDFIEAGMGTAWAAKVSKSATLTIDVNAGTLDRSSGDFGTDGVKVGMPITLQGFAAAANNTTVFVSSVGATSLDVVFPSGVSDSGGGTGFIIPKNTKIGTTRKSFSIEKQFTDISKFLSYAGMRSNGFTLETSVGQPVSGEFNFGGADYDNNAVSIANGHTVNAADSNQKINSTVDMGVLVVDDLAVPYCVEGMSIALNNNLTPTKCIAKVGPKDQIPFEAEVTVDITAHLEATNFALIGKKISQEPLAIGFSLRDGDGIGYAFYFPRVQLSFPDPAMSGKNAHVMIEASGVASYDETDGNTMFVYRLED